MKRILAFALVLVLCLGFAACGETEQPADSSKAEVTTAGTPAQTTANTPADTTGEPEATTAEDTTEPEVTTATAGVSPEEAVCVVGDVYYADLGEAFDDAPDGAVIKITKDFATDICIYPLTIGAVTLDGQGHTITADIATMGFINVEGFELTAKDLKILYTESTKSVSNGTTGDAAFSVGNEGILTLENVEVTAFWGDGLNVEKGGKLTVVSGKYVIDPENNALQSNLICANSACEVIIQDGTFTRLGTPENNRALIRANKAGPHITINGGNWECACGRLLFLNGGVSVSPDDIDSDDIRLITINGGNYTFGTDTVIDGYKYTDGVFDMAGNGGVVIINDGNFEIKAGIPMPMFNCAGKNRIRFIINGGNFVNGAGSMFYATTAKKETETDGVVTVTLGSEVVIKDGTFTNAEGNMFDDACLAENFTVTGGTFNCSAAEKDNAKKFVGTGTIK